MCQQSSNLVISPRRSFAESGGHSLAGSLKNYTALSTLLAIFMEDMLAVMRVNGEIAFSSGNMSSVGSCYEATLNYFTGGV